MMKNNMHCLMMKNTNLTSLDFAAATMAELTTLMAWMVIVIEQQVIHRQEQQCRHQMRMREMKERGFLGTPGPSDRSPSERVAQPVGGWLGTNFPMDTTTTNLRESKITQGVPPPQEKELLS
jgi:hypothetical protein